MAFWGIEVEAGKTFTHSFDKARKKLHLSQATLGLGQSADRTLVQCKVGEKTPIFLCSLRLHKNETCLLDIEFEEEDGDVVFEVIGPQSVHLTGYYFGNDQSVENEAKLKEVVEPQKSSEDKVGEVKGHQVRTLESGLTIENLEVVDSPNSILATPGTQVSAFYIGKLKSDGYIFDANIGKQVFKFKLGVGDVIKGWEIGVNGMRVGEKRRVTIPPFLGYGISGRKDVPANAWLVYDIEVCKLE